MTVQTTSDVRRVVIPLETSVPADRVLAAARDFSPRREQVFPAVSQRRTTVHSAGQETADVTEGTRAGPIVNWERCDYEWSDPTTVVATVTDSNVYAVPGSVWTITATPSRGGTHVEMVWERRFVRSPRGRFFGFVFRHFGDRLFQGYARDILTNIEALERADA